ncbi:hypothetical protein [Cognatiyoonia sp. IB215182]|uniref:hypothetical protein n=1 Tax=Cognatiyoonia sp. IB215182 TaxID=3097353 RepID=UPI002A113C25|nr:hypothetical protein [Cognatiyoonia sp. IB215182]MDX8351330.1 hypothetical protein [Cognatiyoonia sp. IB215182]
MTAGITILIMSGVGGDGLIWADKAWFSQWIIFAGALSGGISLALARGWMGLEGILGLARAVIGAMAIAIMAAMIAGILIDPLLGVVYGPILLVTEFLARPWLAIAWFVGSMAVHGLLLEARRERELLAPPRAKQRAVAQLSRLSQENLYRRS